MEASKILGDVQFKLLRTDSIADAYVLIASAVKDVIGDGIVVAIRLNESNNKMQFVTAVGLGTILEKIVGVFGKDPTKEAKSIEEMSREEYRRYSSGTLESVPDGIFELMSGHVPKAVCDAAQQLMQIKDVYAIGVIQDGSPLGGLVILARNDIACHKAHIELIVNHAAFIIQRKRAEEALKRIEWLLTSRPKASDEDEQAYVPPYGNLVALNTCRLILDSVGEQTLADIVRDYLHLLDTSSAVYEKNGDYALGIFSSGWCRTLDAASRRVCGTNDNRTALDCGQWHCHESCWSRASKTAIETGQPTDIECDGGIRLYAVPIRVGDEIIGAINIGYGDPPRDEEKLRELASRYQVSYEELRALSMGYESRPAFITDLAKKRLQASARLIGVITERKMAENALQESRSRLEFALQGGQLGIWDWNIQTGVVVYSDLWAKMLEYSPNEVEPTVDFFKQHIHPDDQTAVIDRLTGHIEGRFAMYESEHRMRTKSGKWLWILDRGKIAEYDKEGRPVRATGVINDITTKKDAEESLRETQLLLQTAMDQSDAGIAIADAPSGALRYVNNAGLLIRGGTRESIVNGIGVDKYVSSWQLLDLDGRPLRSDEVPLARAVMFGETNNREFIIRRSESEDRTVLAKAAPIKDDRGKVTAAIVVFMDITERKFAERELKTSRARLEALWNVTSLVDADFKTVSSHILESIGKMTDSPFGFYGFVNKDESVMTIHSWSGDAMNHCSMVNKPAEFQISEAGIWAEAVRHKTPLILNNYEAEHPAKKGLPMGHVPLSKLLVVPFVIDGHVRSVVAVANRVAPYDENDVSQLTSFLTSIQTIVDSKIAEEALAAEKERLSVTLQSIGDGVITTDTNGNIVLLNKTAEEMTGWLSAEAAGKPLTEVFNIINEITRKKCENPVERVLATGEILELANHTALVARDNREIIIADSAAPIKNAKNETIGVVLVFRDMTEKKKLETAMEVSSKLESLGVLAGGIAHDFNNLMGGIFGYIDMASEETKETKVTSYLLKAMNTIERARALTQQLLTFAKGGAPIQKIDHLFPFVEETAKFALSGANVSCHFDVPKDLWACNFDKNQIGQVIDNIIINAQQAMPVGGTIEMSARNITLSEKEHPLLGNGNYVKIAVKDTGIGISKELITKIFDPFFTTKTKGHGLGLATCYSIINRHGGCIDVESEQGKGSTFKVYLPASTEAASSVAVNTNKMHKGSGIFLIMDDEEVMRDTIGVMLETLGYTVVSKENGKDAIAFFASETKANRKITGMIFDLTVPGGMGGKAAIEEIRKTNREIPAFVASGYADDPIMKKPAEHGFTASICKPFIKSELSEMLNKYMQPK